MLHFLINQLLRHMGSVQIFFQKGQLSYNL
ncbi:Uncharacterised protein [Staphylococcus warneri]|nr:Uncharacterised protein [Staphylococcus warneri]